jgi:hypothetical protein
MQNKPKNTLLVVIIVLMAVLLLGAIIIGVYYYGKSKTSPVSTASPTKTATVSPKASATPTGNQTTAATEESAREFVERFMKMTLGTLPGASLDVDKAYTYLSDTMKAQYSGANWVPQFYGIQDGPDDYQFLMQNETEDGWVVKYNALWGNEVGIGWLFTVTKDNGQWYINGLSNTTQ